MFKGPQGGLFPEAPPGEGRAQAVDQVPREASSLKLLREQVNRKRVRRTLGVATPHEGEHTKGETGSESWWTLLWCLWRPPSLSYFL